MNDFVGRDALGTPKKTGVSISLTGLKEKILSDEFDNVLIISHINPDPDTLGSSLGLKQILEKLNKTAYIVCDTKVNEKTCGFFDIAPELDSDYVESSGFKPDYIVCVDAAAVSQIGKYGEYYSDVTSQNNISLVIDHHYTNSFYGRETYLDEKAAATGEIIFDLAKELNLNIETDRAFAKNIYCSIICDSGSFKYPSTTPKTMRIAAELMSAGFDFGKLNRLIFQNKTMTQIAIERLAYNSLELCGGGKIAFIIITRDMKKQAGLEGVEIEGINEIARIAEGVEVGVVIKEADPEEPGEKSEPEPESLESTGNKRKFYISLRSNDYVNVAEIAGRFGGGGHIRAAGCNYEGDIDILIKLLTEKIEKVL